VGRDFLKSVDAGNREDAGLLVDFELVAFARLDLFTVRKSDYEHRLPLNNGRQADQAFAAKPKTWWLVVTDATPFPTMRGHFWPPRILGNHPKWRMPRG
jgi:hypothetical protein